MRTPPAASRDPVAASRHIGGSSSGAVDIAGAVTGPSRCGPFEAPPPDLIAGNVVTFNMAGRGTGVAMPQTEARLT